MTADAAAQALAALLWEVRLYWLALALYAGAWALYAAEFRGKSGAGRKGSVLWLAGLLAHGVFLFLRGNSAGWLPLVAGYDRAAVVAFGVAAGYAWYERRAGNRLLGLAVPLVVLALGLIGQLLLDPVPFRPGAVHRHAWYVGHALLLLWASGQAGFACAVEWLPGVLQYLARGTKQPIQALLPRVRMLVGRLADRGLAVAFPLLLMAIGCEALWNAATMGTLWLGEWTGSWALLAALAYAFYFHARPGVHVRPRLLALLSTLGFLFLVVSLAGVPGAGLPGFPAG